jgi:parallel beta-helix repeat protein
MKPNVARRYAPILIAVLTALLAVGLAQAQINTSVTSITASSLNPFISFPWRAGSLGVASFDNTTVDAALSGVYVAGIAFLFPSGQQWVSTGMGPAALVAADLDGDGDVDVAVAEQDSGTVSIVTNDGLGAFTRTASYATGDPAGPLYPTGIAAADISGDGKLDLVVVNRGAGTVVVLHNTGAGLVLTQTVPVAGEPNALVIGDFDKDGWQDVAVACAADDTVKVFHNSHGLLIAAGVFEGGPSPEAIAAADLDNDGHLDLATADRDAPQVTVLLNDGAGRFTPKGFFLSEPNARFETPVDLQIADLDNDGWADMRCAGVVLHNDRGGEFGVADAHTMAGAVYGQGYRPGDPTPYLGVAYAPSSSSNAVQVGPASFTFVRIHVSPSGNDANDGLTWATAKKTIQAGITAAGAGRQVWVAEGTYSGAVGATGVALYGGFAGNETAMSQRDWVAHPTILKGTVTASTGTSAPVAARIDGFTVNNSYGVSCIGCPVIANNTITSSSYSSGISCGDDSPLIISNTLVGSKSVSHGVIDCSGSSATILNNTIRGNRGAAIYCYGAGSPVIDGNTIEGNSSGQYSGGIYCEIASPTITNNTISGNSTGSSYGGGAVCCRSCTATTISNNTMIGNTAGRGGAIFCEGTTATIASNVLAGNSANMGAGIFSTAGSLTIAHNTIAYNKGSQVGGGAYFSGSTVTMVNTIVAFNSSGIHASGAAPTVQGNCVYGNTGGNYSGMADPTGTFGNLSADPRLAAPLRGNFHIQPDSPCVDAGVETTYLAGPLDMDGQSRYAAAHVDIGADESDGTVWPGGDGVIVRVSPTGDDAKDGSSWAKAKRTVQAGIDAVAGGEVWVAAGTYVERITLPNYTYVYGGFAGTEAQRSQREWATKETILDGDQGGSVVTVQPGCFLGAIDGFTIRNGLSLSGGIYCWVASPTIANNRITGNRTRGATYPAYARGAGIYCDSASPRIVNNAITGNMITDDYTSDGAGIACSGGSPTIAGNTIVGNGPRGNGAGIYCEGSAGPLIVNTIVAYNYSGIYAPPPSPPLRNNCVYGNNGYDYVSMNNPTGTNGNISADPRFVSASPGPDGKWGTADDTYGDLHLLPGSPCIDVGSNADVPADICDLDDDGNTTEPLPFDLAGASRFADDPYTPDTGSGTAPIVDIGAYEYHCADASGDGHVDVVDLLDLVYSFGTVVGDLGFDAKCDFNHDGAVDVVDLLNLVYNFGT